MHNPRMLKERYLTQYILDDLKDKMVFVIPGRTYIEVQKRRYQGQELWVCKIAASYGLSAKITTAGPDMDMA